MLSYSVWCVTVSATVNCSVHSFKKAEKKNTPQGIWFNITENFYPQKG